MPFSSTPLLRRFQPLRDVRRRIWIGYGVAIGGVAASAALRLAIGALIPTSVFTTFYPAVAVAALIGDGLAGALAIGLSAVAASFLFHPSRVMLTIDPAHLLAAALFVVVSAFLVSIVCLLSRLVDLAADQADEFTVILEAQPTGVVVIDAEGIIKLVNQALERQLGYSRTELLGRPVETLVPEALREAHRQSRREFMRRPEPRAMGSDRDLYVVRKDGSLAQVEIGLAPLQRRSLIGALATVADITERKDLERRTKILADEVRHRARNLLTVVQALARRSLEGDQKTAFVRLLETFARTQELLIAEEPVSLEVLMTGELASFGDQVTVLGCELSLTPRAAQDFGLIVHELTTNALKYGALSTTGGHVTITGQKRQDGSFLFVWAERGGPAVQTPTRAGLGRTILHDLARSFASSVEVNYDPEGLQYTLVAHLDRINHRPSVPQGT